ncbi:DUF3742 family protein [Pseudomonas aeruginosa]
MNMTTNTHNGRWSHRLGRGAGRAWRGYLRREQRVAGWLVTRRGTLPPRTATAVLSIVKLAVLGVLLYSAFWLALLLAFAVIAAWMVRNVDADESSDDDEPQWRNGLDGYGLYRGEVRIDGGSADDE